MRYHGRIYHVQTEDSGPGHSRVFTHLFHHGSIIASKRHDYDEHVDDNAVRVFMQEMHKGILKDLKRGTFDEKIVNFFTAMGQDPFAGEAGPHEAFATQPPAAPPVAEMPQAAWPREDMGEMPSLNLPAEESAPAAPSPAMQLIDEETIPMVGPPVEIADPDAFNASAPAYPSLAASPTDPGDRTISDHNAPPPPLIPPPVIRLGMPKPSAPYATSASMDDMVLDLDALPDVEDTPAPEPATRPRAPSAPPASYSPTEGPDGIGVYARRGGQERPFARPQGTPPSAPFRPLGQATRPPVVVIRPPQRPIRPPQQPNRPPAGGVVVQRTVVVGGNAGGPNRLRRPRPAVPYVVKEGSHPIVQSPSGAARMAPPVPNRPSGHHPSSVPPPIPRRPSPPPPAATISDKSLDEVILAYLSQDNEPKP